MTAVSLASLVLECLKRRGKLFEEREGLSYVVYRMEISLVVVESDCGFDTFPLGRHFVPNSK